MKRDRQSQIKQLFLQKKRLTIRELCETYGISAETARRDLNVLEADGFIRRNYGGGVLVNPENEQDLMPPWDARFTAHLPEKRAIAREMLRRIPDHSIIALDSGTSIFELARLLREKNDLTILTNDLRIAAELSANTDHTLYYIGGVLKKDDMITTGFLTTDFLEHFSQIDLTLLSADGFDINIGLTDYSVEMGTLKRAMIQKSRQVIVGVDASKFSVNAFYKVCGLDRLTTVITDSGAPAESVRALESAGIQTVLVDH